MMQTRFRATPLRRLLPSVLAAVAAASWATSASAAVVSFEIDPAASVIDVYGDADLTAFGVGIVPFDPQGLAGIPSNVPLFSNGLSAQFTGHIKADVTAGSITFLSQLVPERPTGLVSGIWAPALGGGAAGTTIATVGSDPAVYGISVLSGIGVAALRDVSFDLGGTVPLAGGVFSAASASVQGDAILEVTDTTGANVVFPPTSAPLPLPPIPNYLAGPGTLTGTSIGDTIAVPIGFSFSTTLGTIPVNVGFTGTLVGTVVPGCGNGTTEPGEDCDDNNTADGDCCSSSCQYESAGSSCADADLCNGAETCDGAGTCDPGTPLDCDDSNGCTQDSCAPATGCDNSEAPVLGCASPWEKGLLLVKANAPGKEKLIAKLIKGPALTPADFGDPVAGTTTYDVCIYNGVGALAGQMRVDRAATQCAGKDCWKTVGTKGFLYKDKENSADGVSLIKLLGGDAGKSKILIKGKNNSSKGQMDLPTGIAANLEGSSFAFLQLHSSDGANACYQAFFNTIIKNEVDFFKAK